MSLRYGLWRDWNPYFFLCCKIGYFRRVTMSVTLIILNFCTKLWNSYFSQSYQKSSGVDTSWNFYYFLKEKSCKMIWWRPRTKIHIWTTWMWFKINYLNVFSCMKTHNKASISYFTPPYVLQLRTKKTNHHSQTLIKYTWKTLQRKWKDCTINLHKRNPRKCSKEHELDNRGLKVWQTKIDRMKQLRVTVEAIRF